MGHWAQAVVLSVRSWSGSNACRCEAEWLDRVSLSCAHPLYKWVLGSLKGETWGHSTCYNEVRRDLTQIVDSWQDGGTRHKKGLGKQLNHCPIKLYPAAMKAAERCEVQP